MDYKDYSRREILDKAEYYRSIGKTSHQKKLEDYVKAIDYGTDGFGVPYKKCSDSELKKLMEADPEPEKLPTASKSDNCLLYTSPSPRDRPLSRMPSSA